MRIFGTDGIRGRPGLGPLSPLLVSRIGRALGRFAAPERGGPARVGIGRDPRPSGAELAARLAGALEQAGAEVRDLGVLPSPVVAWAVARDGLDLGVAVSASHNAESHNGLKPFARGGRKLTEQEESEVETLVDADPGGESVPARAPSCDAAARYVEATAAWLAAGGRLDGLRLVVDLAAGAATVTAPPVLRALGAEVATICEMGSRPINEACGTEHPAAWLEAVARERADAGLAFDGDADRVLLAGPDAVVLDGDDALAILAQDAVGRDALPGRRVVGTVMANLGLEERLRALGARLERVPVGDRHVAERMRATGAALGGEPSGHVVLDRDGVLLGDGLVSGVRVLQAARRLGRPLQDLRREIRRYPQVLRSVTIPDRRPLEDWGALQAAIREARAALGTEGRILVRYSGTEPLLRIMAEGRDDETVARAVEGIARAAGA